MPRTPLTHANERIDKVDLDAIIAFPRELNNLLSKYRFQDRQSRISRGFRVELPDQTQFPGRLVVRGGFAHQRSGQLVFDEDNLNDSKTVTLEGSSTTFHVEVEFVETDSDVDARAFWDATVDQGNDVSGDALPDGQEFSANVSTKKTPGWRVVTPISTIGFERDQPGTLDSNKIPLVKLATDGNNEITLAANTNLLTEKASSTMIEFISTTQIRVQNPTLFVAGESINITDTSGTSATTITTVDYETGLLTIPVIAARAAGAIVRVTSGSSPDFIVEEQINRYRRLLVDAAAPGQVVGHRDMMFRGDEVHGSILSEGHNTAPDDQSSDTNLQSMKDQIDFLSAQLAELKFGSRDPYVADDDATRAPPGIINAIPTTPRYFHKAGGVQGARTRSITVGDGVSSWGDFVGADETGIQAAITNATVGDSIYIKRGTYDLANDVVINKGVKLIFDNDAVIRNAGGSFDIQVPANEGIRIEGLSMTTTGGTTTRGLVFSTTNPGDLQLIDIDLTDLSIEIADTVLPLNTFIQRLTITGGVNLSAVPLIEMTNAAGQLRGTWSRCTFNNVLGLVLNGACIQATTPTAGIVRAKFEDCLFSTALINASQIALGAGSKKVTFERCEHDGLLTNSTAHIVCSGGTDLRFLRSKLIGSVNRYLSLQGATDIVVDGYHNENSVAFSQLQFLNCSGVKVCNSTFYVNSTGSLTSAAIYFISNLGTMTDIQVYNNTIEATSSLATGIIFDVAAGGTTLQDIQVNDNEISQCEVGLYFSATAGSGSVDHIGIKGNNFVDRGAGAGTASNQKVGVLITGTVNSEYWNIKGNHFVNLNPATTALVGGAGRSAVWNFSSSSSPNFHIEGNYVVNVGDASNPTAQDSTGFWFNFGRDLTIIGNTVETVNGENAYGVVLSKPNNEAANCVVSNNNFFVIVTSVGGTEVFGITAHSMKNCTFAGNTFTGLNTATGTGGAIGTTSTANSTWDKVSITNNTMEGTGGVVSFVKMEAFSAVNVSITGNTASSSMRSGVEIASSAGGSLQIISIIGNTFSNASNHNIIINSNTATTAGIMISGNSLSLSSTTNNIRIDDCSSFNITGNFCVNSDVTVGNYNIYITSSTRFMINGNLCQLPSTINLQNNIQIGAGCDFYLMNNNMLDKQGGSANYSFDDSASGSTVALATDNMLDSPANPKVSTYGNGSSLTAPGAAVGHGAPY